jgi:hypothetical protein
LSENKKHIPGVVVSQHLLAIFHSGSMKDALAIESHHYTRFLELFQLFYDADDVLLSSRYRANLDMQPMTKTVESWQHVSVDWKIYYIYFSASRPFLFIFTASSVFSFVLFDCELEIVVKGSQHCHRVAWQDP